MIESLELNNKSEKTDYNILNLGPTHPATHGVFQNVLKMDGEIIHETTSTIGYIHRAFEKIAEHKPFYQITTLTDRLNYCSSPINNMGWHMTVEKLLGVETPKRVDYMRVIIMEFARIADHLVCNSIIGADTGALTGFTYVFQWREKIYDIFESNKVKDLQKFLSKRSCLNNCNIVLIYLFHIIQSIGILTTTIATGYEVREYIWIGIGLNILAS